jgi:pyruvate-formate lyase-activating enzyme
MKRKTLRLILWRDCPRSCENCVNKTLPPQPEFDGDFIGYDEIVLTGGEPLLSPMELFGWIHTIRRQTNAPIYVYTAIASPAMLSELVRLVDGVTLTIHEKSQYRNVIGVTERLIAEGLTDKSLRLNSFVDVSFPPDIEQIWKYDRREFIVDCPIPEN